MPAWSEYVGCIQYFSSFKTLNLVSFINGLRRFQVKIGSCTQNYQRIRVSHCSCLLIKLMCFFLILFREPDPFFHHDSKVNVGF